MKINKKSIVAFIFSICLIVPSVFLLAACGGGHKHSFSSEWTKSETHHWHECIDKNCDKKQDFAEHDFVWTEKTPAGVHTDKVETGTCSTCQYQKDRTVEGSGANIHSWVWKANEYKHWQQTTCEHETPLKQNEQDHTWVYTSEGELTHRRTTNCGAEKHATRIEPNIPHRYDNVDDTTCNDCGNVRSLTGKGLFNPISEKTYNAREQGVAESDYKFVDEAIKSLCEIQYRVKGSNDAYTKTAPTNAGTYEVRLFCKGNDTYLQGEVAKTEYVINQIEVPVASFFKLEKQTTSEDYINLKTYEFTDASLPSTANLTLRAYGEKYKNQGRYTILKENDAFEGLQFDNTNFKPIPTYNTKPQNSVGIIVYTNETPVVTGTNQTAEYSVSWIDFVAKPYVILKKFTITSGTLQIGDYLICEGINVPLKLIDVELNINNLTEQCSGIAFAGETVNLRFAIEGFITKEIAGTKLINTTFTKVDYAVLAFNEGSNTTNQVDVTLQQNESMYLEFTATVDSAKTFKINFKSDGGYRAGESFKFYNAETGEQMTSNLDLVSVSAAGTYKIVIKITKVAAELDHNNKTVQFSVTIK